MIRSVRLEDAQRIVYEALQLDTGAEVEEFISSQIKKLLPNL